MRYRSPLREANCLSTASREAQPARRASSSLRSSTRSMLSNSTTPMRVRCWPPARTRGASQRRNVSVIVPSAIPSSWEALNSTRSR